MALKRRFVEGDFVMFCEEAQRTLSDATHVFKVKSTRMVGDDAYQVVELEGRDPPEVEASLLNRITL